MNEHALAIPIIAQEEPKDQIPTVSVVVPVHQWNQSFTRCLQALLHLRPRPLEIIISVDGELAQLDELSSIEGLTIHASPIPAGPAAARNAGAAIAKGDILLFIDSDVLPPQDIVSRVARRFSEQPWADAVIGSYDEEPAEANFFSQYKNLAHHWVHQQARPQASTFWTACGAIRRGVFLALGGFDQSYRRPCVEDIELGYRLKNNGGRITLDKNLQVTHLKRWDAYSLFRSDFYDRALPWSELILNRGPFINDLNLTYANRISVALSLVLAISLPAGLIHQSGFVVAGAALIGLLLLNSKLLGYFIRKRGLLFTLKVIPWHWFYLVYSGVAFAWVFARSLAERLKSPGKGRHQRAGPAHAETRPHSQQGLGVVNAPAIKDEGVAPGALAGPSARNLVSVIVPAYNAERTIRSCLSSLAAQEGNHRLQVIVVDSSNDHTAQIVAHEFPWVELLCQSGRRDPGQARNLGIAAAKGSVAAFIDADCRAAPNWIENMLFAHALGRPVVGGSVDMANPESLTGRAYYYCLFGPWLPGGRPRWVDDQPTANLSFERSALDRLGPFLDRGLCSDSQMQWRMKRLGLRTWFDPSIKVWHYNPVRMQRLVTHRYRHGQAYARLRAEYWRWSRGRRLVYLAMSPLLMLKLTAARIKEVLARPGGLSGLLPCLPLVLLGMFCWTLGEAQGYGRGGDQP